MTIKIRELTIRAKLADEGQQELLGDERKQIPADSLLQQFYEKTSSQKKER